MIILLYPRQDKSRTIFPGRKSTTLILIIPSYLVSIPPPLLHLHLHLDASV